MFQETYIVPADISGRLLNEVNHPNKDEINKNNLMLEKRRIGMIVSKKGNCNVACFGSLDLSFLEHEEN